MAAEFDLVTIDTSDTDALARFWAAALGLHEVEREDGDRWVVLADSAGVRRLGVQKGGHVAGGTHLDLRCDPSEFHDEMDRLVAIGAVLADTARVEPYGMIVNFTYPDGNPFDLCAYHR